MGERKPIHERNIMRQWPKGCSPPEGYCAWHEWAEAQEYWGLKQEQCATCSRWFYPQENHSHEAKP